MQYGANSRRRLLGVLTQIALASLLLAAPRQLWSGPMVTGSAFADGRTKDRPVLATDLRQGTETDRKVKAQPKQPASGDREKMPPQAGPDAKQRQKPLKPFRPTERISADQAVDFPSDI